MNQYLLLWFEAPMQSWGFDSKFDRRDTLDFPTKSGVLGLLCCARGAGGEERDWLARLVDLDMQVRAYTYKDEQGNASMREPFLHDFHMVGSGYNSKDPWQTLLIPKTNEGKKANGGGTKITHRYYLQDHTFAVVLQVPENFVHELSEALTNPVWDLYLGRKSCVPAEFIMQGIYSEVDSAFHVADKIADSKNRALSFQVLQGRHEGEVLTLNDVPVQFGRQKKYRDRQVTVQRI